MTTDDYTKQVHSVFVLMSGEKTKAYRATIKAVLEMLPVTPAVKKNTVDYEMALRKTLRDLMLNVNIMGSSLSNTVERIRPVNGLTRLVRPVQVMKQWFTGCTGRGSMVTCISLVTLHFNLDGMTRTSRTGRETMVYESYSW